MIIAGYCTVALDASTTFLSNITTKLYIKLRKERITIYEGNMT
jgi:hypothetical protein